MDRIRFICKQGHIEVYLDDLFLFSADNMREAREELEEDNNLVSEDIINYFNFGSGSAMESDRY